MGTKTKIVILILLAVCIIFAAGLLGFQPFAAWIATLRVWISGLSVAKFANIPATIWGLIGSLGAVSGIAGVFAFLWKTLKSKFSSFKASSSQEITKLSSEKKSLEDAKTEASDKITVLNKEKEELTLKADEYKGTADRLAEDLKRQAIAKSDRKSVV